MGIEHRDRSRSPTTAPFHHMIPPSAKHFKKKISARIARALSIRTESSISKGPKSPSSEPGSCTESESRVVSQAPQDLTLGPETALTRAQTTSDRIPKNAVPCATREPLNQTSSPINSPRKTSFAPPSGAGHCTSRSPVARPKSSAKAMDAMQDLQLLTGQKKEQGRHRAGRYIRTTSKS